ncbi:hypothetical protein GWI33_002891 [Rhynchophorus ferrugineus]|uniref:Uncharacterized protein n=1 Tax=Rhynchophorus ferrugineus TaxID=354439 RepID=A0A834IJZ3_RHYFE|nr:hypothetical protein GWI33_002891 [Rhynchophorus ferrugineus]
MSTDKFDVSVGLFVICVFLGYGGGCHRRPNGAKGLNISSPIDFILRNGQRRLSDPVSDASRIVGGLLVIPAIYFSSLASSSPPPAPVTAVIHYKWKSCKLVSHPLKTIINILKQGFL